MDKTFLKKSYPHLVALLLFIIVSFMYFSAILEGKQMMGHDTQSWACMAKETCDYNATHSAPTLWTNSMFGGMPTYQISTSQPYNVLQYVEAALRCFPGQVFMCVLYLICFYILLLCFDLSPWLSIAGTMAFTFASYNFVILAAGHNSKAITIAYIAPLIGAIYMAFRSKRVVGSLLTALFLSLAIRANHVQILYYAIFIVLFFGIGELILSIKDKTLPAFLKSVGMLLLAAIVAVGMNATSLLTTYDYSKATMRGDSNGLTMDTQSSQHGLNKDYITNWSYGIDETLTILIPDFKGGESAGTLTAESETGKKLASYNVPNVNSMLKEMKLPLYWGAQPFTSGPVYLGAVVCLLFVLGLFIVDRKVKLWLLPMILITLMLSWGKNFMWLTDIFINYVPMYNKFRTVSMTLVATGFGITLLAVLALKEVLEGNVDKKKLIKQIGISTAIAGGLCLLFVLIPSFAGSFVSEGDAQFQGDYSFLKETLPLDRMALLRADAFRSLAFILVTAGLLWLYAKDMLKRGIAYVLFTVVFLADLVPVAKRYMNNDLFEHKHHTTTLIEPSNADKYILQDKTEFRVLDATVNIFNDASPSYFHKNIGGYHAAKLRRYQELINMQLDKQIAHLFSSFNKGVTPESINQTFDSLGVLNMLNMKYLIYNKEAAPIVNPKANGNAWFIKNIRVAKDANEEMTLVGTINTKTEMVIDKSFENQLPAQLTPDSSATISLKSYEPNHLVYTFNSKSDQVAVFSEIYYDKGWNAYINGQKVPYVRANYLLRAMPLKAGNYEVEFKFEPLSYSLGNNIAIASSSVFIICLFGFFILQWKKNRISKEA